MKRINTILAFFLTGTLLVGCNDEFFNRTPTNTISSSDLAASYKQNPNVANAMLNGVYSTLFVRGTGGTDPLSHTDFGQKSVDIATDLLSGDIAQSKAYAQFYNNEELLSTTRTSGTNIMYWKFYYKLIKSCNDILAVYGDDIAKPIADADKWGQAKAVRGYAYYNLALLYSKGYSDGAALCVPIYTISNKSAAQKQSTVKEVFDFAKVDLIAAVDALKGFKRTSLVQVNQNVANGILSYICLNTGDYTKAIESADAAMAGYAISSAKEVTGGFNSITIPGWMWGVDVTSENTGSLITFWGNMDIFTYGYAYAGASKMIDKNLFDQIQPNDVRKFQFSSDVDLRPIWKFYDAKRVSGGDRKWENDILWMRVDELYLVKAEAQARSGQNPAAVSTLQLLLNNRAAKDGTLDAVVGAPAGVPVYDMTNVLDAIYLQWRIEMWGEGRGLSTLKRFQKTVTRGANHPEKAGVAVPYDDIRLTFRIPELEAINNPYID